MPNYTTLLLRFNALVEVNLSLLKELFPNLTKVDLRDNPLDCKEFARKKVLKVIMITGCEVTASVKTTTMKVTKKTLKTMKLAQPTTAKSILPVSTTTTSTLPPSHSGTSIIIYMTVVISTVLLMPVIILCLRSFPSIALRIPTAHNFTRD